MYTNECFCSAIAPITLSFNRHQATIVSEKPFKLFVSSQTFTAVWVSNPYWTTTMGERGPFYAPPWNGMKIEPSKDPVILDAGVYYVDIMINNNSDMVQISMEPIDLGSDAGRMF